MQPMYTMLARSIIAAVAFAVVWVTPLAAQDWPTRAVTMVVGFAPGGGTDVLGRIIGRRLSEVLGQQVIIENVGGAGGMVGSARVAKGTPDGYQFVLGSRADAINQNALQKSALQFRCRSRAGGADRRSAHALGCAQGSP